MTQHRPDTPAERLLVAGCYALAATVAVGAIVATFSDDLNSLAATVALWATLVPLCLVGVIMRACGRGIRTRIRHR